MKNKIGYLLLIIISIVGSRLIFGKDYHLNSNNLLQDNLYLYQIFDGNKILSTYVDEEHLYYVSYNKERNSYQYQVIKYNLIKNIKENEYTFNNSELLNNIKIFMQDSYIYLTATDSNVFYKFNNHLDVLDSNKDLNKKFDSYGLLKDGVIYTINNDIFYQNKLYDTVPASCGKSIDVIYDKTTYLHFHNGNTGFGCLYNASSKKIEYLDYENVDIVKDLLLEYQGNRLSFKYNRDTYYFNDITESDNLVMRGNGDYLFTIDTTNANLKIYNLETQKIIYNYHFSALKNAIVDNILIGDYAYFTITKDNKTELFIWDYLKETRRNTNMISYDEKEYKFKNNELVEEIKNNYQINVNLYDKAVDYFDEFYVIPSYDDILINSRLLTLKKILEENLINLSSSNLPLYIFFDKDIINHDNNEINSKIIYKYNCNIITINITNDNFEQIIKDELGKLYPEIGDND